MEPSTNEKPYACQTCRDSGHELVDFGNGKTGVRPCTADPCAYTARRYGFGLCVPKPEQSTRLGTLKRVPAVKIGPVLDHHKGNEHALQHAKFFVDGTHHGLYLHGMVGVGKTAIACGVLNGCMLKRVTSRFVHVPSLLRTWIDDEDDEFQTLVRTPVVCLDDVGAQQGTDYARRTLQTLFDARESAGNRTIWTSNFDLNGLAAFLEDDRLTSRIQGTCRIVEVGGPDHRLKGPKAKTVGL